MKNATRTNISKTTLLILSTLIVQSCSSVQKTTPPSTVGAESLPPLSLIAPPPFLMSPMYPVNFPLMNFEMKVSHEIKISIPPKYENFDKIAYPNEAFIIAHMIAVVQPELNEKERDTLANYISQASKRYDVEPQIIVSIIDTESNFQDNLVSSTGDVSVAQINVEVWNKEFLRMNMPLMDRSHVMSDSRYAIMKMAEILQIIKKRHEKRDSKWYARYHSNTDKHKSDYINKLQTRMKMLATSKNLSNQIAQIDNLEYLSSVKSANLANQAAQNGEVAKKYLKLVPLSTPKVETGLMLEVHKKSEVMQTATLLLKDFSPTTVYE